MRMATLSLKISLDEGKVVKTIQFDPSTTVYDACKIIREKLQEATLGGEPKDYGLFLSSEDDPKKGVWMEPTRNLDYYMLRNGDVVEYKRKLRTLRVRMLDDSVKTLMVDDSQIVANLMVVICTKIGITNYDEYSLVRDDPKDEVDNIESKPNYGTLTLKRKTAEKERDAKMDQLRKKLRTDDEVNWVDPSKTLREQGVEESEMVLLQRKFFFSDRNIDSRDPIQLGLLYVQARNAIVDGTHPVTQDKACEFAGIQCQIQFGDHREERHIAGFLDLKEFLPASYFKVKGIEKKVFKEHRKHQGTTELEAKVLYTKTARALKTYGVAFFLVKEKMKGKNKLVPRLLGVTKDSVLRLDEKTKEILYTWPLTTVRRWCASANTFTLDFGDYSDQYYSVQTTEAEQILQVISGYIDIILKKQKAKDHFGIEGDEGSTMVEDSVSPSKATILQHESSKIGKVNTESLAKPAVMRAGNQGVKPYSTGHLAGAQYTTVSGQITIGHTPPNASQSQAARVTSLSSEPQRALLSTITMGREIIEMTERELVRAPIPELGSDAASLKWKEVQFDNSRQAVTSQIAAMNAATAQVVTLTSGSIEEVDHTAVGAAITTITTNLPEMTKGVQMLAALMDDTDNGDKLLNATRKLCSAFSDLLKAAEPETKEPRQNLLNAASRVGEASTQVLHNIGEDTEENKEIQDILLALAKAVANTTAALVLKAKNIAATCRDDQQVQNRVITAATQCALATSQLVACAKVVAPTLHNPACREQLTSAARSVARAVEGLLQECANAAAQSDNADDKLMQELTAAAQQVTEALNRMLEHVNFDRRAQADTRIQESSVESVMTATDRLISSSTDAAEMVKQARLLGQATAHLIQSIKTEAEGQPELGQQRRLLAAAKLLAEATARMVEAARACASSPRDSDKRQALCRAAEELRDVAADYAAAGDGQGRGQIARLQDAAKQAASEATQLISSVQSAGAYNTNKHSQELVLQECKILSDTMPKLVEGVKICSARPTEAVTQLDLINASEAFLQASGHVAQASRAILPTVQDQAAAKQLGDTTQHFTASCTELRTAVNRARASCKGLELDAATELIKCLQYELEEVDRAAKAFQLRPLPGETAESASQSLSTATRGAASATAALVSAARHGGAPRAAGDAAAALQHFTSSVRAVVATNDHQPTRERVIQSGQDVLRSSITLIETVKYYLSTSETVETTHLVSIAKDITQALEQTSEAVPSHREVDSTMENITETMQILSMGEFPPTDKTYGQLQNELNTAAEYLNLASSDVVQSVDVPASLGEASKHFGQNFNRLMGVSMEMAGQTKDYEAQSQMVSSMRTVSTSSSKLLNTAKSVSQDLGRPNAKNQLANAARDVTDAINQLVDVCTSAAPGQKECDSAVRRMRSAGPLLQHPSEPVNDHNYFSCVDTIVVHSKTLSEGMSGMANSAKHSNYDKFVTAVRDVSDSICGLVECTAQAAYLVAVSDESSVAGRAGLVDQAQFARAAQAIQQACDGVVDPNSNQQQVLSAATVIAKHTSALCNACRVASSKTANPAAKRHFVQAAKDVANSTAALVKEIKALDNDYSQANRSRCGAATAPLLEAVRGLCQYADSPEFASVPAKISPQARRSQDAILESGRNIISGACSMVESARALVVQPADRPQWQQLAAHTNTVSHAIKALVTGIRDKAPGQRECLAALDTINNQIRELDQASLSAVSQSLVARRGNTLQGYTEQMETVATEIIERLEPLRNAAKFEAENLGHSTVQLVSYIEPLVAATVGAASNITESRVQMSLLDQTKTVLEGTAQLVLACKDSGGNPRATAVHADVDEHTNSVREAAEELTSSVRTLTTQHGLVSGPIEAVQRALARITDHRMSLIGAYNESDAFVDYQTRMVGAAKEIARLSTDMTVKSGTDVTKLAALGGELSQRFGQLAQDSVGASATTPSPDVAQSIRSCVVELGEAVVTLIKAGGQCQLSADSSAQRSVADSARSVNAKVGNVLSALQAGSKGTQACTDSVSTIAAIIGDLDTTILFASAGTLHAEKDNDTFAEHREGILKTARTLVEDTKTLVGGAAGTQEQLADAAQQAVLTIVQLSEVVKAGAASLSVSVTPESQVLLLHAVRDVASALKDLVHATKLASGKPIQHPAMDHLKECAKLNGTGGKKRWSLPNARLNNGLLSAKKIERRRSSGIDITHGYNSSNYDSETDWFVSDQEEELLKLLDYSSQDDEVTYGTDPPMEYRIVERYDAASRNSVIDMDWRVVKYGESILIGEIRSLVDVVESLNTRFENIRKREKLMSQRAKIDLDVEMKNINEFIKGIDEKNKPEQIVPSEREISMNKYDLTPLNRMTKPSEKVETSLKNTIFKVKKITPVNLVKNLDIQSIIDNALDEDTKRSELWKMVTSEGEMWKAVAIRNLRKNEETKRELERFSGNELKLGDYDKVLESFETDSKKLTDFIQKMETSRVDDQITMEYDEKYNEIILKLIEFAKKDFPFKGFDPLIVQLEGLANTEIGKRKIITRQTDTYLKTSYTYKELCQLEKYYEQIINQYDEKINIKENITVPTKQIILQPILVYKNVTEVDESNRNVELKPVYHKKVILNVHTGDNMQRNIEKSEKKIVNVVKSPRFTNQGVKENNETYEQTRTYPLEYYANNWWTIYEDVLKTREEQFGSIDNWWNFYEKILKKTVTDETELLTMKAEMERRNRSRKEAQLKMLNEPAYNRGFKETEEVQTKTKRDDAVENSVMVTNVTSLLKTVKAVEDEHTRGTRALEATIESIAQEIKVFLSGAAPRREAAPEDLLRCTRGITVATAKAVAAGNSGKQDDIVAAANLGRKAVSDMLAICKGAAYHHAESGELRDRCLCSGRDAAQAYRTLLQAVAAGDPTQLPARSRDVAQAVAQIATVAEQLKGSDWVDPDDPTVIAESELLGAAASIDAAANKLAALRPRKNVKEADENLNFDEMILEAAKSIISATSALVRAASAAQRELIDQGAVARRPVSSSDDGQWSEGLVSAARLAAAAAHSLAEAANALVLGLGSEERLIGAAKQVASSTAQLLVACKVKADPNSESTRRLQAAGAAVIRSTDNLVRAARQAISHEEDRCLVLDRRMVGGIAQEIDARSEVVRIERELEEARVRLTAIRQAKYKLKTGDTSGDETDNEITLHSSDLNSGRQDGYASDVSGRFRSTYQNSPTSPPHSTSFGQNTNQFNQNTSSYGQNSTNFGQNTLGNTSFGQTTNVSYGTTPGSKFGSSPSHTLAPKPSPLTFSASNFNNYPSNVQIRSPTTDEYQRTENNYTNTLKTNTSFGQNQQVSPLSTFSSFGRSETTPVTPKTPTQYQGFTTRVNNSSAKQDVKKHEARIKSAEECSDVQYRKTTTTSQITQRTSLDSKIPLPTNSNSSNTNSTRSSMNSVGYNLNSPRSTFASARSTFDSTRSSLDSAMSKKKAPPPPPRQSSTLRSYETRSYETPRPIHSDMTKTEETRMYESHQSEQHSSTFSSTRDDTGKQMIYDTPRPVQAPIPPMTPTFDARSHLKFETDKSFERMKPGGLGDGTGQTFNEIHKSTEKIPGGEITSETKIKSESYQSRNPREEFFKDTFTTSTPSKFGDRSPGFSKLSESEMRSTLQKNISTDLRNQGLVKIATPDSTLGRVSSPYGKEVHSYGGPNYMQESSTEVKEIPNGTQKITMTKIYSSSPVTITSTNTKYDLSNLKPIKLDGLDELSKSFDQTDSRFGTLDSNYSTDSKFGTLDSKLSSHTSRSFMRPSDFQGQTSEYQTSSAREVNKPSDLVREIDTVGDKLRKQTISSETIERKTVVSSSTKSETSSTTTKKFGNF